MHENTYTTKKNLEKILNSKIQYTYEPGFVVLNFNLIYVTGVLLRALITTLYISHIVIW